MSDYDGRTEIERKLDEEERLRRRAEAHAAAQALLANQGSLSESAQTATWPPASETPVFVPQPGSAATNQPLDASGAALRTPPPAKPSVLHRWKDQGGILGAIATGLLFVFKFLAPAFAVLGKLKFLLVFKTIALTFGSMALSMWAYSTQFGWRFGVGLVLLIFFHECGHAIAGMMKGIKPGIMVFIPFMGAFVTLKGMGRTIEQDAFIGIMGPVFGAIGGLICVALYAVTEDPFFLSLAYFNFFMNLFNLAPTVPLDGGWIVPLFSPKLLAVGAILMVVFGFRNPMIWVLGFMSLPRIIGGWKADPATQPYYAVSTKAKVGYGFAYVGLAAFLGIAMMACSGQLEAFLGR